MNRNFIIYSLTFITLSSCRSYSVINPFATQDPPITISEMNCDQLKELSQKTNEPLKGLAGLKGLKICKDFSFSIEILSENEKKIYTSLISELNPPSTQLEIDQLSIKDLKFKLAKTTIPEDKFKAFKVLRTKLRGSGKKSEAALVALDMLNWSKKILKKDKKNAAYAGYLQESALIVARNYWTDHNDEQAQKILNETALQTKDLISIAENHFLRARIYEESEKFDEALSQIELGIKDIEEKKPSQISFTTDRIKWMKSWILYKAKLWELAEKSLEDLAATTTDHSEKSRALFFRARALKQLQKEDEAKKVLESLLAQDFYSYYALVTYHELGQPIPPFSSLKKSEDFKLDTELKFLAETDRKLFFELIRHREYDLAEKALPVLGEKTEQVLTLSIVLAQKAQRYLPLFAQFTRLSNDQKKDILIHYPDLIFPRPYNVEVQMMSEKTQLPPSLIYSIMKQESAFNEKTRSHADAMGLMQVIPRLAKQLSKKFEVPFSKPEDLFNPQINIQLGSFELMEQVKKQSGQLTFVAAAYNAGPNALANWLKTRKRNDMLEFIEDIPYDETRTYVKIIARNKIFYERISKRDESLSFPIEFLVTPLTE